MYYKAQYTSIPSRKHKGMYVLSYNRNLLHFKLVIRWPDGHVSPFDLAWLRDRSFCSGRRKEREDVLARSQPQLFKARDPLRIHQFQEIMDSDERMLAWLKGTRDLQSATHSALKFLSQMSKKLA